MAEFTATTTDPDAERKKVILVVEDEILIRVAVAEFLRDTGYDVIEAAHATEATTVLATRGATVDIVFTDINMPGGTIDGFGLADWIGQHYAGMPVLFTSAVASARDRLAQRPFVGKPYSLDQVERQLRALLELGGASADGR